MNILAYEKLASDPDWVEKYRGQFAIFALGKFVEACETFESALIAMETNYSNNPVFFKEVGNDDILDIGGGGLTLID